MKLSMGTTDVVQVFIKTMGDEILQVSATTHKEIDGVLHIDEEKLITLSKLLLRVELTVLSLFSYHHKNS